MTRRATGAAVLREDKTEAVSRAVLTLLGERGWSATTMDAVASRAGVGKPALYRRWPSKDAMILDCVARAATVEAMPADTGNLRDDLLAFARPALAALADPVAGPTIAGVLTAIGTRPALTAAIEDRLRTPRREAAAAAFHRAIARGEIPPNTDVDLAIDLLAGPTYMFASGIGGRRAPFGYAERLVDAVIRQCDPAEATN